MYIYIYTWFYIAFPVKLLNTVLPISPHDIWHPMLHFLILLHWYIPGWSPFFFVRTIPGHCGTLQHQALQRRHPSAGPREVPGVWRGAGAHLWGYQEEWPGSWLVNWDGGMAWWGDLKRIFSLWDSVFFFLLGPKLQIWGLGLKSSMDESKRVLWLGGLYIPKIMLKYC